MAPAKRVSFRFGDVVQLEAASQPETRYRVQLVGVLPGLSLLVTAPELRGRPIALTPGDAFNVRVFDGDDAIAFTSSVTHCCTEPYPYLHLSYPMQMDRVQTRNARRTRLQLPAQARLLRRGSEVSIFAADETIGPAIAGVIRDLSIAGAQFESAVDLGPAGTRLVLTTTLSFERLSGRAVVLPAEVRNVLRMDADDGSTMYYHGLQFVELAVEAELALSAFVYRHLAAQLMQDPSD